MKEYFEELSDQFIDDSEKEIFEQYLKDPSRVLMEMANVRGMDVEEPENLPFSFYFSSKSVVHNQHGIRVKITWNPIKALNADGYMELHGNYDYVAGSHKYIPTRRQLYDAEMFFKKYKVLFAAVWEEILYDGYLTDFFRGRISLVELISKFEIEDEDLYYGINHCKNLIDLERFVRKNNIFNMND